MRFVLDTNQLVSALIVPHGNPAVILNKWKKDVNDSLILILSEPVLNELVRVLHRTRIRDRYDLTENDISVYVHYLQDFALFVDNLGDIEVIKDDPSDDVILATAIVGRADYIVSGDKHLLDLKEYQGIKIATAAEFVRVLERGRKVSTLS